MRLWYLGGLLVHLDTHKPVCQRGEREGHVSRRHPARWGPRTRGMKEPTAKGAAVRSGNGRAPSARPRLVDVSRTAMAQLSELVGSAATTVSEIARADGGWRMHVEIVELERIPQSTSILATYEVETDGHGNVASYRRVRRYVRSEAGEL